MHLVTVSGTARSIFKNVAYPVAGKTGTSQVFTLADNQNYNAKDIAEHLRDHALFVGFAPVQNPKVLVATVLENGGWGKKRPRVDPVHCISCNLLSFLMK